MEEKKMYSIIGKVEIGTDEYRELIETAIVKETEASEHRSRRWQVESELSKKKEELEAAEKKIQKFKEFLMQDKDLFLRYQMWLLGEDKGNE